MLNFRKYPGYFPQNKGLIQEENQREYLECEWITGAALMIKAQALGDDQLNQDFFFGGEDVDFAIRLKKKGYKLMVATGSKIWHKGGVSRRKVEKDFGSFRRNVKTNLKLLKMHHKNYYWYLPLYGVHILIKFLDFLKTRKKLKHRNFRGGGIDMLEIKVHDIKGHCPVHEVGDKIIIDDPRIILEETDNLCTHALSTLLHYTTILEHDWCPVKLGLTTPEDDRYAYMQCVDPGKPYSEGGTVIFQCRKIED